MVYSEGAKVIEANELVEIIEEEFSSPTVERLMFIETKGKDDVPGKIFPCYLEAWGKEENAEVKVDPGLRFQMAIAQYYSGEFSMIRVVVLASELGVTKRIWDKPPKKALRDETPWAAVEAGVQ